MALTVVVVAIFVSLVVTALVLDRRASARGHRLRSGSEIWREVVEHRKDMRSRRAFDNDTRWTSHHQRGDRGRR